MRIFKKSISILLSVLMLFSLLTVAVPTVSAVDDNNVYFINTLQWSQVNVYAWYDDGSGSNEEWPGISATLTATAGSVGIYSYDIGRYDGVVFNNGGSTQTGDLSADSLKGKYFEPKTNMAYNTAEAAMAAFYGVTSGVAYYVCGAKGLCGSEWQEADPNCIMTSNGDGSYTKTFKGIKAGTYQFKINTGKWASEGGEEYPAYNYIVSVEENNSSVDITLTATKSIVVNVIPSSQQQTTSPAPSTSIPDSPTDYYNYSLVGYINGKNVGEGNDAQSFPNIFNLNGQVTLNITQESYVYVKTTDNNNWYMTAGWLGYEAREATMYNTNNMPDDRPCDKLYVNPGKATFTLKINNDGTLSLSYTLDSDGTTAPSSQTSPSSNISSGYYFPTCESTYSSLYSALESVGYIGKDLNYYCNIAVVNGLTNYTGTVEQNTYLLNLLKAGKLINPEGTGLTEPTESTNSGNTTRPTTKYFPACDSSFTTLAAGFASVGIDYSSISYRTLIAQVNGVSNYQGTTNQNGYLLALLKQGMLLNPDYNSNPNATEPSETVSNTVYVVNNVGWDNVYVFYWGGTQKKEPVYPGSLAKLIDKENNIYSFDIGDSKGILFTDGGSEKTMKIGASQAVNKFYNLATDMFYDTIEQAIIGRTGGLIPVAPPEYYFTVIGDKQLCGSDWKADDSSNVMEYNDSNDRYEVVYSNVPKGEYNFLVITNGERGYYDFNLEGEALDSTDYATINVKRNNSTVVIGCDAVKAYASINGEEIDPGDRSEENSYLTYTYLNDGTAQITGFMGTVEHLVIPDKINGHIVTSISSNAFYYCQSFKSVTIPPTINDVGLYAFEGCTRLSAVYISDMSAWCNIEFGNIYSNPLYYAHNLYLNKELVTELIVPDDVNEIKVGAFYSCFSLRNIVLPENIRFISLMAFWNCINLESIAVYNDNCGFYEDSTTIPASTMLYGYNGSTSHMFASNFGRTFISLNVVSCHIWSKETVVNSTCAQDGKSTKMCIICGDKQSKIIEASGHTFGSGNVIKKATYFAKGKKKASCLVCGQKKTVKIPMKKLGKPTVTVTAGKKQMTVKYKKVKKAKGFQVKYKYGIFTYKKNFSTKKTATRVIKNLYPGNYKVQVRAYISKGGKKAYSNWTTVKKIKVKA